MANTKKGNEIMNVQKELAACPVRPPEQAARKNHLHNKAYRKTAPLSRSKYKLLVEIRGLVGSLHNPFLSQAERESCEMLFYSTMRKLIVLLNGFCSGCNCVESKDSERPK